MIAKINQLLHEVEALKAANWGRLFGVSGTKFHVKKQ